MLTLDNAKAYVLAKMTYGHTEITSAFVAYGVAHIKGLNNGQAFHWEVWIETDGSLYGEW
jgi:hypothetical protein